MKKDKNDGFDYEDKASLSRAKDADLITLPEKVEGTNCANCKFVNILDKEKGIGFCNNKEVLLAVTKTMCCKFWDAKGAIRSWEKK